ncbi:mediator of RNA polymerase II transcription subunit 4 [Silene latifolia]|uniref:mediator of RNA polymerase II transcription subunit 4 n=1 Tax=Silene latifolia TaxID=37657 RepID=UPI003D76D8CD
MFQNVPHQIVPSPARLGLSNPNSPALQSPSPAASKPTSQPSHQPNQPNHQQQITLLTPKITSPTLLSLLPPLPRAQTLLLQMGSLATKLFDVSPNRASWLSAFRGSLPTFLSSQIQSTSLPTLDSSVSNTKEIISLFTSLQTQLFEAVSELQEIIDLEDTKQKLNREIEIKDASILSFTKKLHEAERVLDILVDDYADYRRPKRSKSEDTDDDSSSTTVATQLKLSDVISYAHKISYTTFAPPEFGAGGPLRGALPPAPQEDQMRASQLYTFADLDVGLPKMAEDKERAIEPLMEIPTIPEPNPMGLPPNFPLSVPAGWQPGMPVELPRDLPLPPPGWKPGDPIPLPPMESAPLLSPNSVHQQQRPAAPAPPPSRASEVVHVNPIDINILGDDSSDEYSSSSEEMSDDED